MSLSFTPRTPFEVPVVWGHTLGELWPTIAKPISGPENAAKSARHCPSWRRPLKRKNTSQANLLQLVIHACDPSRVSSPLVSQFGGSMPPKWLKTISGLEKTPNSQVKPYFQIIKLTNYATQVNLFEVVIYAQDPFRGSSRLGPYLREVIPKNSETDFRSRKCR